MQTPGRTGQAVDLGDLPRYWKVVADQFARLENLPSLEGGKLLSARAFDEAQAAGPRTYMAVTRYLEVARDNHQALLALLEHHGATLWAPWSLLRPAFETAFLAAWILDPTRAVSGAPAACDAKYATPTSSASIVPAACDAKYATPTSSASIVPRSRTSPV